MYHVPYNNKYLPPGSVHTHNHRVPRFVWTICVNYRQHAATAAHAHHSGADRHIVYFLKLLVSDDSALRFGTSNTVADHMHMRNYRQHALTAALRTRTIVARIIVACIAIASARRSGSTHIVCHPVV